MNIIRNFAIGIILCLVASLEFGCTTATGPAFQKISQIPQEKGLVYIYRPDSIMGAAIHYDVYAGDVKLCDLVRGGYCTYLAKPGELEIWGKTEAKGSVTVDVKAGQEHYVKGGLSVGVFVGHPNLTIVDQIVGSKEIEECKLLTVNQSK